MSAGEAASNSRDTRAESWDLFCRVVDNYGDIGVAWRLARQLADDAHRAVRLWVDDLDAFARIEPGVDAAARRQRIAAIEIVHWRLDDREDPAPAEVVIELFGCGLPQPYVDAIVHANTDHGARAGQQPAIWIDLEYLSAEPWVDAFHGLPSPHPSLPVVKYFYYPGFGAQAGGLLIEPGLDAMRRAFIEDASQVEAFWRRLHVPPPAANERRVSLFAYPTDAAIALFEAMASDSRVRWSVVVPEGVLSREVEAFRNADRRDALTVFAIPFVAQDDYDRLLWSCDVNFVRGEDTFVRAQCAARPFVWHIYPQADDAHLKKLSAFLDRYETGLPPAARDAQRALWHAWNGRGSHAMARLATAWTRWCEAAPELSAHAEVWRQSLASHAGLVDRLAAFVAERRAALLK